MPLLRIQRYAVSGPAFIDYFVTVTGIYDAQGVTTVLELDPALFPSAGEYAVVRATGSIVNWLNGSATWIGTHPSGYSILGVSTGTRNIGGTDYECVLVTVG
jgi:hypothetical protein